MSGDPPSVSGTPHSTSTAFAFRERTSRGAVGGDGTAASNTFCENQ